MPPTPDEVDQGFPGGGGGGGQLLPAIGVPSALDPVTGEVTGFVAERTRRHRAQPQRRPGEDFPDFVTTSVISIPPSFFDGDQYRPAGLPPDKIFALQQALVDIGLIDKRATFSRGVWDEVTAQAYERLLGFANRAGHRTPSAALRAWRAARETQGVLSEDPESAPLQVRVSNPDELRRVFRSAIIDQLGEGWDSSRLDRMVAAYQETERQVQTEAFGLQEAGGELVDIPSPETFAQQQVESEDPTGVRVRDFHDAAEMFFSALEGPI